MADDRWYFLFQSRGIEPRLWKTLHYDFGDGLLPSVAQPPLPLHEFLPLQPLSPVLQPPLPLQEFWPWQACLSDLALPNCSETPGFPVETAAWVVAANEPLISPAIAAPATIAFFVIWDLSVLFFSRPRNGITPPEVDQICTDPGIRASVTALSKCVVGRKAETFTAALAFAGVLALRGVFVTLLLSCL